MSDGTFVKGGVEETDEAVHGGPQRAVPLHLKIARVVRRPALLAAVRVLEAEARQSSRHREAVVHLRAIRGARSDKGHTVRVTRLIHDQNHDETRGETRGGTRDAWQAWWARMHTATTNGVSNLASSRHCLTSFQSLDEQRGAT